MVGVEDDLTLTSCPVCCEDYEENGIYVPRMLPCHYTICEACVMNLLKRRETSVICPHCRKQYSAPDGVKTFGQNEYILSHIRKENKRKIEKNNQKGKTEMSKELCSVHDRESNLYCIEKTCEMPICPWCLKTEHKDHDFEDLHDIKKQKQGQLMATLNKTKEDSRQLVKDLRTKQKEVVKFFNSYKSDLTTEKEELIKIIEETCEYIRSSSHGHLMRTIMIGIINDVENAEAKIERVAEMATKGNSSIKDITAQLDAANKLQEDEEHSRRHQERCIIFEDMKRNWDAKSALRHRVQMQLEN